MHFDNNFDNTVLYDLKEPVYSFIVRCKHDSLGEILLNIKLTMFFTEKGIAIKYKKNTVKEIFYGEIESWKLNDNIFKIIMQKSEYIFKIKENKGIYCNLAMGYFTHRQAYYNQLDINRKLVLEKI